MGILMYQKGDADMALRFEQATDKNIGRHS
jgi:hypothetical protein